MEEMEQRKRCRNVKREVGRGEESLQGGMCKSTAGAAKIDGRGGSERTLSKWHIKRWKTAWGCCVSAPLDGVFCSKCSIYDINLACRWLKLTRDSHQCLVGHVSLILQLNQPPLQLVPGPLCLLPQLLLPLQMLPLYLCNADSCGEDKEKRIWWENKRRNVDYKQWKKITKQVHQMDSKTQERGKKIKDLLYRCSDLVDVVTKKCPWSCACLQKFAWIALMSTR